MIDQLVVNDFIVRYDPTNDEWDVVNANDEIENVFYSQVEAIFFAVASSQGLPDQDAWDLYNDLEGWAYGN